MIVVIDPKLKELFFDRIMEMCGNSPYQATKWIESVAYGEKFMISWGELDGYIKKIEELEILTKKYKESWMKEKRINQQMRNKVRNIDEEVEIWMDQIQEYKSILTHSGLGEYV